MPFHLELSALLCCALWALSYALIIRQARIDKRIGMPLIPLCANISYEFIFGFIFPDVAPVNLINQIWFGVDVILFWQLFKYGPEEFTDLLPRSWFVPTVLFTLGIVATGIWSITIELHDEVGGDYTGWGDQVFISAAMIALLTRRKSTAGQSMYIALSRMLGTIALVPVQLHLMPGSIFMNWTYAVFLMLDATYLTLLYRQFRKEGRDPWAFRTAPAMAPRLAMS